MTASRAQLDRIMGVMDCAFDPAFGEAWNARQLASALLVPGTRFAIIDIAGVIGPPAANVPTAGFYLSRQVIDEEELLLIAVDPQFRHHGHATRLLQHLASNAAERGTARLFLEMREDNPARSLYENHGFSEIGRRPGYYRGGDGTSRAALTFSRIISKNEFFERHR